MPTPEESLAPSAAEPLIFQIGVEGVLHAFRARFTAPLEDKLRALGLDPDALQPGYPLHVWEGAVRLIAAALWPDLPAEEAWQTMGREFLDGYFKTVVGKAALVMGKVIGPKRLMERMGRNFRIAGNYLDVETTTTGVAEVELRTRIVAAFLPQLAGRQTVMTRYRAGVLVRALEVTGAQDVNVEVLSWDPQRQEAHYRARWKA